MSKIEYKVVKAERQTTKAGKPYYNLELQSSQDSDSGGVRHPARIWDDVLSTIREGCLPEVGQYWAQVQYRTNVFQGVEQMIVSAYSIVGNVSPEEKERFMEPPVIDVDRVLERMFLWRFWDGDMKALMAGVVGELQAEGVYDKIRHIPAGAAYHHSVRGGFLLHIDELLTFADCLCNAKLYGESLVQPGGRNPDRDVVCMDGLDHYAGMVDYQILRAAIVLHDIGKVYDYSEETLQFQENPVSQCLEHTLVGILLVERYWPKKATTPESVERELRLKHALAAHHGREMGAVAPKTPEAILLHHLDMISASLDVCRTASWDVQQGGQASYSKMLGVRPFVPEFPAPVERVIYRLDGGNDSGDTLLQKVPWES